MAMQNALQLKAKGQSQPSFAQILQGKNLRKNLKIGMDLDMVLKQLQQYIVELSLRFFGEELSKPFKLAPMGKFLEGGDRLPNMCTRARTGCQRINRVGTDCMHGVPMECPNRCTRARMGCQWNAPACDHRHVRGASKGQHGVPMECPSMCAHGHVRGAKGTPGRVQIERPSICIRARTGGTYGEPSKGMHGLLMECTSMRTRACTGCHGKIGAGAKGSHEMSIECPYMCAQACTGCPPREYSGANGTHNVPMECPGTGTYGVPRAHPGAYRRHKPRIERMPHHMHMGTYWVAPNGTHGVLMECPSMCTGKSTGCPQGAGSKGTDGVPMDCPGMYTLARTECPSLENPSRRRGHTRGSNRMPQQVHTGTYRMPREHPGGCQGTDRALMECANTYTWACTGAKRSAGWVSCHARGTDGMPQLGDVLGAKGTPGWVPMECPSMGTNGVTREHSCGS
ncbi:hypothetical protein ACH5RR_012930 [Cinchona calisaya]|uniref:Uncharacterized protein n=1 Tax=Cinchona calisaya TaxID=153742 RepID=A0ABD2ZZY8_9GENT